MGLYERQYYRADEQPTGLRAHLPQTAIGWIILVNVAVMLVDFLFGERNHAVVTFLESGRDSFSLWYFWQFLTAGFVHDPIRINHILFNMFGLWMLGRPVEERLGAKEFTAFYLVALVASLLGANLIYAARGWDTHVIGASGAVTAVTLLFVQMYPRQMIMFMFVIRMPVWVLGVIIVASDVLGSRGVLSNGDGPPVAYEAHLIGVALALAYWQLGWRLWPGDNWLKGLRLGARPRLRVHDDDERQPPPAKEGNDASLAQQADRILDKLHSQGESSLTPKERQILETYSRMLRQRRPQ